MKKKVLIVEDEEILASLYEKALVNAGFKVMAINDGKSVLNVAETFGPDMILMDHSLSDSDENGMDLLPKLKKMFPEAFLIMLSNYSSFQLKDRAVKAGADDFLVKLNTPPSALKEHLKTYFGS